MTANTCDTDVDNTPKGGQSGSPVFYEEADGPYITGMVSYGSCVCNDAACSVCVPSQNFFQQLTSQRFSDAISYIQMTQAGVPGQ